jgi:hypothetical protein
VERCRAKITSILNELYSMPFATWYGTEHLLASFLEFAPENQVDELTDFFYALKKASERTRSDKQIALAIRSAHLIILSGITSLPSFEQRWATYDSPASPSTTSEEDSDDQETLDGEDCQKSTIHRFLHKLAWYNIMCHTIISELVSLHRSGHDLDIAIETVDAIDFVLRRPFRDLPCQRIYWCQQKVLLVL